MGDQLKIAEDFERQAGEKFLATDFLGAAELYEKAANCFKLAHDWDKAGETYKYLADCYSELHSNNESAQAYVDAAHCYQKTSLNESIYCLREAANTYWDNGRLSLAAGYCKEIAEIFESKNNLVLAMEYYEEATDIFEDDEESTTVNQCKLKVAIFAAQLEQYQKAIEIFEDMARQSLDSSLLKNAVKGYLLNAGICHLCKGNVVAITNALERYQDLDPSFSKTKEHRFLADLSSAIDDEDVAKFTNVVKEFESETPLDSWKNTLLLRVKEKLKPKANDM